MNNKVKGLMVGIIVTAMSTGSIAYAKQCIDTSKLVFSNIQISLNGKKINLNNASGNTAAPTGEKVEPFILNDRTYLPLRAVSEAMGINVDWDANTGTVLLGDCSNTNQATAEAVKNDDVKINLNGNYVDFSNTDGGNTKPCIINNRTYLPVRAISEALGMNVGWDANTKTVNLDNTTNTGNTGNTKTENTNTEATAPASNTASQFETRVLELCNAERAKEGLAAFTWSDALANVARAHSKDMSVKNYFSHTNQEGLSPFDRMKNAGISYSAAAENIAMGQTTPEQVVNGWMNSPGHRANIMNPRLTKLGVGMYEGSNGIYWTQNFTN